MRTALQAKWPKNTPRDDAAEFVLRLRGRRVLEDTSEEKRRFNPLRNQSPNCRKLDDWNGSGDERRNGTVIVAAGSNECYRARVVHAICIAVNAFVQLRRDAQY
jgi:hypothetical protein